MHQESTDDYLQKTLLTFTDKNGAKDLWTVDDATKGISILGGTGSGKTSGSGRAIALKYLNEGWGGIVLTVKPDETQLWRDYCDQTNRNKDLIVFENNSRHTESPYNGQLMTFNPIDYELKREGQGGGNTQNIINIFMNIYRMGNRIAQEGDISKEERFWDSALKRCIGKTVELLKLAGADLSMENIFNIILSCSSKDEQGIVVNPNVLANCDLYVKGKQLDDKFLEPMYYCPLCLAKAKNILTKERETLPQDEYEYKLRVYQQVYAYFVQFLNSLDEKTKFTIFESFMGLAEPFLSGILNKHFAGATNIYPESTFAGKIIIINFPVKEYLDVGIIAQCVFKLMFQQAVERRLVSKDTLPVFLWADEAHMFVNPYDQLFLTTARSVRCSTVYLTQSISNYFAVMGSGHDSKAKVDSLMGNLSTKIFHANSDAETNEYASRLIGLSKSQLGNSGSSRSFLELHFQQSEGVAEQFLPQVQPREFTTLKSGGAVNKYQVQAIVFVSGKLWSNNTNFYKTSFSQNHLKN
jgi:hypothetical protein